jgi:hypothetical protein
MVFAMKSKEKMTEYRLIVQEPEQSETNMEILRTTIYALLAESPILHKNHLAELHTN